MHLVENECIARQIIKIIRACNIQIIICNFKRLLLLNKMVLISYFLTGVLYDRSKPIYEYLNDGDKIRDCYSCLQLTIQPHLPVGVFFAIKHHFLIMKGLAIKIFA